MLSYLPCRRRPSEGILTILALSAVILTAGLAYTQTSGRPPFAALRGQYVGVGTIVVTEGRRKTTLSGKVRIKIRVRNRSTLIVSTRGQFLSNRRQGLVRDSYRLPSRKRANYSFRDGVTGQSLRAAGTSNLGRSGARYTLRARGAGSRRGVVNGSLTLRNRTLRLNQTFRGAGNTTIQWNYLTTRNGR